MINKIILFSLILIIQTKIQEIKLKKVTSKRKSHQSTTTEFLAQTKVLDFQNQQYVAPIYAGSNKQYFRLLVDTGSSTLWIPSINCYECASSGAKHLFNSSESTTFKASVRKIFLNYDIGQTSGILAEDTFYLAGLQIHNQQFLLATIENKLNKFLNYSISYFGIRQNYSSYFDENKESNKNSNNYESALVLGGINDKYKGSQNIAYCDRFDEVYWSVSFDGLSLISDGDQIDLIKVKHDKIPILVDSGTSILCLQQHHYDELLFHFNQLGNQCYDSNEIGSIVCTKIQKKPSIQYNLCGNKFNLEFDQYVTQVDDELYIVNIQVDDMTILGQTFLSQYYTIFDKQNAQIGFVKAAQKSSIKKISHFYSQISPQQSFLFTKDTFKIQFMISVLIIYFLALN